MIGHDTAVGRGTVIGENAQVTIDTHPADCSHTSDASACVRCRVQQSQIGAVDKSMGKGRDPAEGDSNSSGADRGICDRAQLPHREGGPHHRLLPAGQCACGEPGADLTLAAVRWRERGRACHGLPWKRPVLQGKASFHSGFPRIQERQKSFCGGLSCKKACRCSALKS